MKTTDVRHESNEEMKRELDLAHETILELEKENERLREELSEVYVQLGGIVDEAV